MLVLFETSAGYAIFKISDENKLSSVEDISSMFTTTQISQKLYLLYIIYSVKLHAFKKFKDTAEAVKSLGEFMEGNMPKDLKTFLKKNIISKEISEKLLCIIKFVILGYDKKVAKTIKSALEIETTHGEGTIASSTSQAVFKPRR